MSLKGRVALPSKFRKDTGNKIIIARWYENCLVIVGPSQWSGLIGRFARQDEVVVRPIRSVERYILSTAFEVETDNQGRFVVPPMLREMVGIKNEIIFLGLGERIELWDLATWLKEEKKVEDEADAVLEEISQKRRN